MRVLFLISVLIAPFAHSENLRQESLMISLNKIFQSDLEQIKTQKKIIKNIKSRMSGCYYEEESFSSLKALVYPNCADVILEAREKLIPYYQMRKITERYNLKGAFETLQRVYGSDLEKVYEDQQMRLQVLKQNLNRCEFVGVAPIEKNSEDLMPCHDLLLEAMERGLSYLQIESIIQN